MTWILGLSSEAYGRARYEKQDEKLAAGEKENFGT